ncbi:MAG: alanyl-tRNA synthetase [Planctomycetota bacterium]|jgi:alanyl-tRNA synthetase
MPANRPTTAADIRKAFIDFFVEKAGHTFAPSSPVVPHDDPTLLFTNAGMNQFKDVFLGRGKRPYTRAVNTQKCIRAGGKHNDLEDVGKDTYHHTFFEMLGNWSFGDYFKQESIRWGFELLTKVYGLDPNRLYATWFEGNPAAGLEPDLEAKALWESLLPKDHVLPGNMKDNFWEMGDTGPCGPCTEIHYDRIGGGRNAAHLVNSGDPDVLEIWNHVFIQFNREPDRSLKPLPAKHVDTGMGLERLVSVIQDKRSNYDTDLWAPVFEAIRVRTGARAYSGKLDDHTDIAYRVIADHIRCLTLALTDGATPSNEGRGYVLRRILRRAVRHGHQTLGVRGPFLKDLVPAVVASLGGAFPELAPAAKRVAYLIEEEEIQFGKTLERGLALFADAAARVKKAGGKQIAADDAFRLHDTSGFPIDLTQVMAEEAGMTVDVAGYEALMEAAREKSRAAGGTETGMHFPPDAIAKLEELTIKPTDDHGKFGGKPTNATLMAIWNGKNFDESVEADSSALLAFIFDKTPMYAEMGGQVADHGSFHIDGAVYLIEDVQRAGSYVLHIGRLKHGRMACGATGQLMLERDRRDAIRSNHSATHALNLALRAVAGDDVEQKGSLVDDEKLRFDYAAKAPLSIDQIKDVERRVNASITANLVIDAREVPLETARKINGVRAVFGERYPDPVRVVSIGATVAELVAKPDNPKWKDLSIEFCGGTHLGSMGEAKQFVLVSEGGLAAGVRRVFALTGPRAMAAQMAADGLMQRIKDSAKLDGDALGREIADITKMTESLELGAVAKADIDRALEPMREKAKAARKQAEGAARDAAVAQARALVEQHATIASKPLVAMINGADAPALLAAIDAARAKLTETPILFLSPDFDGGKVAIAATCPKSAIDKGLKAGDWVKAAAQACGGAGGGRPDTAQAGGKDPSKTREALDAASAFAGSKV